MTRSNPSTMWIGLGLVGLGGGAWVYSRMQTRRRLQEKLEGSESVKLAIGEGLVAWGPEGKAAEMITFTNAKTADEAFAEVLASLPKIPGQEEGGILAEAAELGTQGKQIFEQATGLNVDPYLAQAKEKASAVYQYFTGGAKENPDLSWPQHLAGLR